MSVAKKPARKAAPVRRLTAFEQERETDLRKTAMTHAINVSGVDYSFGAPGGWAGSATDPRARPRYLPTKSIVEAAETILAFLRG